MAQISLRIDDDVKKNAETTLDEIGLTMSTAITIFLKTVVREQRIPFELTADPFYSKSNMEHLNSVVNRIENGEAKLSPHDLID